jgi:hypothetical protein
LIFAIRLAFSAIKSIYLSSLCDEPDGSFKVSDLDDTQGDAFRYGIWFLQEAGYFQRKDRFWTDQDFPDSRAVHDQIEAKLRSIGLSDPALKEAYETLHAMD